MLLKKSFHFPLNVEVNDKKILREFSRKAIQNNNRRRFFAWQKLVNFMSFHELFKEGMYMAFKDFLFFKRREKGLSFYPYLYCNVLVWYLFYFLFSSYHVQQIFLSQYSSGLSNITTFINMNEAIVMLIGKPGEASVTKHLVYGTTTIMVLAVGHFCASGIIEMRFVVVFGRQGCLSLRYWDV